ncbi:hypothetical protein ACFPYJ_00065 [Paenibacillus solisilvae]|uniref:HNH endonuclease n=1 Tax=Paenibacillus solisilvae TaxID=2486751 RepID=A0ABW0VSM8_9BACL
MKYYGKNKALEYLNNYPKLWKWMNQCRNCGHIGYKPNLPEHIHPDYAVPHLKWNDDYIRRYFKPLSVNENGFCDICNQKFIEN